MTVGKRVREKSPFTIASNSLIHVDLAFGRAEEALVSEILLLPFVNIHYPIILQMVSNQDDKQKRHYYKAKLDNSSQSSSVSIHRQYTTCTLLASPHDNYCWLTLFEFLIRYRTGTSTPKQ